MAEQSKRSHVEGTTGTSSWAGLRGKPFALWVIFGSLVYIDLAVLIVLIPIVIALGSAAPLGLILLVLVVFPIVFFVAAFFSFRGKRWAFILAAASTTVFVLLNLNEIAHSGSNPADAGFPLTMSLVPAYFLVLFFSILSFLNAKKGIDRKRYLATHESSGGLFTLAAIGFVIGAVVSGAIGAGVVNRLIEEARQVVDIEIVDGAVAAAVPFSPASLTVSVGDTVTWLNTDSMTHTVTSDTGAFDSGLLSPGDRWSYTFTQAGTYAYHCTPHPQMTGTIVVT